MQFCKYYLSLHFGLRGAEVQTTLQKDDIVFDVDSEGKEFATIRRDFLSKNCPGGLKAREFESTGRLQDARQVKALKKLIGKLHPEIDRQRWTKPPASPRENPQYRTTAKSQNQATTTTAMSHS